MIPNQLEPLVQTALGDAWHKLAEPVRRHYGLRCGADENITLQGIMRVDYPNHVLPLIFAARLSGALVHRRGNNINVIVRNHTRSDNPALFWHRTFRFPNHEVVFTSRMEYLQSSEITEIVGWGLGIRLCLSERNGKLIFTSNGYQWRIGSLRLNLPDWLLLGKAEIIEQADGDAGVKLDFNVVHPWWGRTYEYSGQFNILPTTQAGAAS